MIQLELAIYIWVFDGLLIFWLGTIYFLENELQALDKTKVDFLYRIPFTFIGLVTSLLNILLGFLALIQHVC
jgi:hypothetical protein